MSRARSGFGGPGPGLPQGGAARRTNDAASTGPRSARWPCGPALAAPAIGEVQVWRGFLPALRFAVPALMPLLSAREGERAGGTLPGGGDEAHAVGRGVLRLLLGAALELPPAALVFGAGPCGKPALAAPFDRSGLQFNLSRSGDWLLWALARGAAIGIDIERRRALDQAGAIAERVFARADREALQRMPPARRQRRFFALWTCSEALAKASGAGMLARWRAPDAAADVLLRRLVAAPGHAAALAVHGPLRSLHCRSLAADVLSPWLAAAKAPPRRRQPFASLFFPFGATP